MKFQGINALLCGLMFVAASSHAAAPDDVLKQASEVANNLVATEYGHRGAADDKTKPDIRRDADGHYTAYTDCSGFVSWVVGSVSPQALEPIESTREALNRRHKWAQAYVWQAYFSHLGDGHDAHWQGVTDLRKLAPGDVLSWCADQYCANASSDGAHADNTGHITIVRATPEPVSGEAYLRLLTTLKEKGSALPPNTQAVYSVAVVDSSGTQHYNDKTRLKSAGKSGVGTGSIYFAIDNAGKPIGLQFPTGAFHYTGAAGKNGVETIGFGMGRLLALP